MEEVLSVVLQPVAEAHVASFFGPAADFRKASANAAATG